MNENKRVIVFDDDKEFLDLMDITLNLLGYTPDLHPMYDFVPTEENTLDVLAFMCDYNCPPVNGEHFVREYSHILKPSRTILTSSSFDKTGVQGFELYKPFMQKALEDLLVYMKKQ